MIRKVCGSLGLWKKIKRDITGWLSHFISDILYFGKRGEYIECFFSLVAQICNVSQRTSLNV